MSSSRMRPKGQPIPRTVERCELYLDRLALVIERAGKNATAFLPIVRRLERELAEARSEGDLLRRLRQRRLRQVSEGHPSSPPNPKGNPE